MQLARCEAFASVCAFVRFDSLTAARLAEYDGTGRKSTPFFFYFHQIIRVTSLLLASCYHPRFLYQPHHIVIDIVLVASRRIVQLPTVHVSAALTIHEAH